MTKQELKEQNEALRNLLMEIREMIDSELEAMDDFEAEDDEEEEEDED
jgi:septal ring factor EnvC (AmiA/AmiB activator)